MGVNFEMKKKLLFLIFLGVLGLSFFLTAYYAKETALVLGYGTIEAREIHLGSKIGGRVSKVLHREGDTIEANEVIFELDAREIMAQKSEAMATLSSAQANLRELLAGYRPELIEKAQAQVEEQKEYLKKLQAGPMAEEIQAQEARMKSAQADLQHAKKTYERVLGQVEQKIFPEQEKDNALRTLNMAQEHYYAEKKNYELLLAGTRVEDIAIAAARLAQAQAEWKRLKAGPRKEEMERAEAFLEEIKSRIDRLQIQIEECYIKSSIKGQIEVFDLEAGDILAAGRTAATIIKPHDLWVKIYIREYELHRVALSQNVSVIAEQSVNQEIRSVFLKMLFSCFSPATEKKIFTGKIVHIASQAEFTPRNVQTTQERGNQVFAVKVEILDTQKLRPGMSVMVQEKKG